MILNTPMLGGMMRDDKTVKVQGYKGKTRKARPKLNRSKLYLHSNVPLNTALVNIYYNGTTETIFFNLANSIPLQQIAKLVQ